MAHDAKDVDTQPLAIATVYRDAAGWDWQINVPRSDVATMAKHLRDMADAIEATPSETIN